MNIKSLLLNAGLAGAIALTSGCAALVVGTAVGAAGVAGYAYVKGELKGTEAASLDKTWAATQAAMKDLEFVVVNQRKDAVQAELEARTAKSTKVTVDLKSLSDTTTEVRIRVGTFGDKAVSLTILEKIKSKL
jgi:hypothetical protein